jgi:hypothetical protein
MPCGQRPCPQGRGKAGVTHSVHVRVTDLDPVQMRLTTPPEQTGPGSTLKYSSLTPLLNLVHSHVFIRCPFCWILFISFMGESLEQVNAGNGASEKSGKYRKHQQPVHSSQAYKYCLGERSALLMGPGQEA